MPRQIFQTGKIGRNHVLFGDISDVSAGCRVGYRQAIDGVASETNGLVIDRRDSLASRRDDGALS